MKATILSIAALLIAATAGAQTVDDVLRSVEMNNLELKALLKGNEASSLELKQQNSLDDLSVEYSPFFNANVSGMASSELVVTQGFDFPTLYGARRKANRLQGEVKEMEYLTARRDVLLAAKSLCLDLIYMNKRRALLDERRRNADELMAMYTEKYDNGDATALELNKVKMERMNLETELVQAEAGRNTALQQLRALNGDKPVELEATEYPALPAVGDGELYGRAVAADLSVRTAEASVKAAEQDVKVNRQSWIPKIEVGYRRNTDGDDASNGFLIGGSIPLFSSKNKVKAAKARRTEAQMRQAEARVKAESGARAKVDEIRRLRSAAAAYDVPLMRQTLKLLRTAVENGEISVTDYYVEADGVYRNMQAYIDVERLYQGSMAEILKNEL